MWSLVICVSSLKKCLFKSAFAQVGFFVVELQEFFVYSGYQLLPRHMVCTYFLPFGGLPFHSADVSSDAQKLLI